MRRVSALAVMVAAVCALVGVGPARADFHGACAAGSSPGAAALLTLSGSTLTYTGTVKCVGRNVTIDSLTFVAMDGKGRTKAGPFTTSCTNCTGPISISGTYTAQPVGEYAVYMAFTVSGIPQRFRSHRIVTRAGGYTSICGGADGSNQQLTCPVPDAGADTPSTDAMVPDLEPDH